MRTATCFIVSSLHPDPLDFPFQLNAGMDLHTLADCLPQRLDIGGAATAKIDEKMPVQFRHLRATEGQTAAAGIVNQFPGAVARWIFEGRAAGPVAWLACVALPFDRRHSRCERVMRY